MSDSGKRDEKLVVKEQTGYYESNERYELINGVRYDFLSSPRVTHQIVLSEINASIRTSCYAEGLILVAPMDVYFDTDNVVQPDIIFIRNENLHIIKDGFVKGVPDLLVEVLSPSNGKHDIFRKRSLYERVGVQEYWIVDAVYCTINQYILEAGVYKSPNLYGEEHDLLSPQFPCIRIELAKIFQPIERFREQ